VVKILNIEYPGISVIVACLNEEEHIAQCLESLIYQSYQGEIEILISDGGSSDDTIDIVTKYSNQKGNIRLLHNQGKIQATGRNLAIRESKYELIAYLDGHSYADKDWLQNLYRSFSELSGRGIKLAGVGSVHKDGMESDFSRASKSVMNSFLGGSSFSSYSEKSGIREVETAYACLYDKKVLFEAGLYDETFTKGEDLHLNLRITRKFGYKLYIDNKAVTYYYLKGSLRLFARQMFDYGFWRFKVMSNLNIYSIGTLAPMIFVVILLFTFLMTLVSINYIYILALILILYIIVITINSIYLSIKDKINLLLAFVIQLIIHMNYGIGMIYSIFKKK
jgi:succinoglycan biosynthesis protein ExoA